MTLTVLLGSAKQQTINVSPRERAIATVRISYQSVAHLP